MLPALNEISTFQSAPTQDTLEKCYQLLYYASIHPNATIRYHASDVILIMDTYSDYLVLPVACCNISVNCCFTNLMTDYSKGNSTTKGTILT